MLAARPGMMNADGPHTNERYAIDDARVFSRSLGHRRRLSTLPRSTMASGDRPPPGRGPERRLASYGSHLHTRSGAQ